MPRFKKKKDKKPKFKIICKQSSANTLESTLKSEGMHVTCVPRGEVWADLLIRTTVHKGVIERALDELPHNVRVKLGALRIIELC